MQIIFGLSAHFLAAKTSPPYMHTARRKKRSFTGNSARTSNHFSVMFFRKTRKISADVQAYSERNLTQYSEKPARTSNYFSAIFFRKTRLLSRRCICIPQGARNAVLQETQPESQLIFRRCFFRKTRLLSRRCIYIPQGARNKVLQEKLSPKPQIIFRRCFFVRQGK